MQSRYYSCGFFLLLTIYKLIPKFQSPLTSWYPWKCVDLSYQVIQLKIIMSKILHMDIGQRLKKLDGVGPFDNRTPPKSSTTL